jgi:hypothetical protein
MCTIGPIWTLPPIEFLCAPDPPPKDCLCSGEPPKWEPWTHSRCDMASRKTLNVKNLEALGSERLAGLLIESSRPTPPAVGTGRRRQPCRHGTGDPQAPDRHCPLPLVRRLAPAQGLGHGPRDPA